MRLSNKAIIYFIFGILFFVIFAYDIEHDKDFGTWAWLLNSQLCFMIVFKDLIEQNKP